MKPQKGLLLLIAVLLVVGLAWWLGTEYHDEARTLLRTVLRAL